MTGRDLTPAQRADRAYEAAVAIQRKKRRDLAMRATELLTQWVNGAPHVHIRVALVASRVLTDYVDRHHPDDMGASPREVLSDLRGYLDRERTSTRERLAEAERNQRDETAERERQRLDTLNDVALYLGGVG